MKKHTIVALCLLVVVIGFGLYMLDGGTFRLSDTSDQNNLENTEANKKNSDPKSITYTIDTVEYPLVNGKVEIPAVPGLTSTNTLMTFGEPVMGDLDSDGDADAAVLLQLMTGGSGTFYYAALALNENNEFKSTNNVLFLGDRIAPQTIEITNGYAVFNYAERLASDSMTTPPSLGKSLWIQLDKTNGTIGEFVQDFEGEVSAEAMQLDAREWTWIRTEYTSEPSFVPQKRTAFKLIFGANGAFSAETDCNGMGGKYEANKTSLTLSDMMSTQMYCEGSDEGTFSAMLRDVSSYSFGTKGELLLKNKTSDTMMIFQ